MNIKTFLSEEEIEERLDELAMQIEKDYVHKEIYVVCVLKGASFFTVNLTKRMKNMMEFDFVELSSYGEGTESSGNVIMKKDIEGDIEGKDVLIIEDIVDSGNTMKFLLEHIEEKKPNSIKVCTLLNKRERRRIEVPVDYVAFEIPNKFIVGYGLDYTEFYRNLPYIGYVDNV